MKYFDINSVSAGFENSGISRARVQFNQRQNETKPLEREERGEGNSILFLLWKFYRIVFQGYRSVMGQHYFYS